MSAAGRRWGGGGGGRGLQQPPGVCSVGLQPSVSKCTLIYVRRSEPHLLMHGQIWAPLLPLSPQHPSAHLGCWDRAGRSTGRCLRDGALAHPRDHDARLGACTQQTHSAPWTHESLQPTQNSSVAATLGYSLLSRTARLLHQGFLDTATSLDPGRTLGIIKTPKGTAWSRRQTGTHQPFPTREGLTVDPVPLKSRSEEGGWDCHNLGVYIPSLLEIKMREAARSPPFPFPYPRVSCQQPGHQPQWHSHEPAEEQTGCCNSTRSPTEPIRLSPLPLRSPARDDGEKGGSCISAQPRQPR